MATFIDRVTLHAQGGKGGNGCASVRREKFKPLGGPDGGNGGDGGSVILRVDPQVTTLLSFHHSPHQRAENGGQGEGSLRAGKNGADCELAVPAGTTVRAADGTVLADLTGAGSTLVIAAGGRGGLGNAALASPRRKAPGFALLGEEGEAVSVTLELKSMADAALVGFPSAGKSSLIAVMSAAKPKIADYPFTTLVPNLGVVQAGEHRYTIADVPGLIPGASEGKGLGLDFLRHIERCAVIVHVLDCATLEPNRDPVSDFFALEKELLAYWRQLSASDTPSGQIPLPQRPRIVVLNKIDIPEARAMAELVTSELAALGLEVYAISTATQEGVEALSYRLAEIVARVRAERPPAEPERIVIRPPARDDSGFTVKPEQYGGEPAWRVRGEKPERWVAQTDFSNDEAVGYLADRLNRFGVEEELTRLGAVAGDTVFIGPAENAVVFDFEPTIAAGAELLGPRGTDQRLQENLRPTRREKREAYYQKMDAATAAREELWAVRQAGRWTDPADDGDEGES